MDRFTIEQTTGANLRSEMSGLLVKSPVKAIEELVSNSYDADAGHAIVLANDKHKTIAVEDDGLGMDEKGLDAFLRMGDSVKIREPISPKGRKRIGKFGIATVLIEFLGGSYDIETWCDKTHIIGSEVFGKNATNRLEYEVEKNKTDKRGTKIFIKEARFVGTKQLHPYSLKYSLTWKVPNRDDFYVILNGERLVRRNTKADEKFSFKDKLPIAGEVDMCVDYFNNKPKISGVQIYVNEREVGGKDFINLKKISNILVDRVYVAVNANEMQQYRAFDTSRFREDNDAYKELRSWIYEKLREVKSSVATTTHAATKSEPVEPVQTRITKALTRLQPTIKYQEATEEKPSFVGFRMQVTSKGASAAQAHFDSRTKDLLINPDHLWYNSNETIDSRVMDMHIQLGTAFALAQRAYLENFQGSNQRINDFYSLCGKLLDTSSLVDIKSRTEYTTRTQFFVPFKLYKVSDIVREHMSLACLHALVDAGVLNVYNDTIKGFELDEYMRKAVNYSPTVDVVRSYELTRKVNGRTISRERARQLYSKINETLTHYTELIPFMYNIGKTKPFFLIENESIPKFLGLYAQGAIKKAVYWEEHVEKFKELFDKLCKPEPEARFVELDMLCEMSRSSPHEVFRIISYAHKNGVELHSEVKDNVVRYSAQQFKKAREQYLLEVVK